MSVRIVLGRRYPMFLWWGDDLTLIYIDVSLPRMSGLDRLELIRQRPPQLLCLMLSGHGERSHVDHALMAGARGYILKGDTDELASALRDEPSKYPNLS